MSEKDTTPHDVEDLSASHLAWEIGGMDLETVRSAHKVATDQSSAALELESPQEANDYSVAAGVAATALHQLSPSSPGEQSGSYGADDLTRRLFMNQAHQNYSDLLDLSNTELVDRLKDLAVTTEEATAIACIADLQHRAARDIDDVEAAYGFAYATGVAINVLQQSDEPGLANTMARILTNYQS